MQQSVGYDRKGSPLCMDISKFFESVAGYYVTFEAASERPQPGPQSPRSQGLTGAGLRCSESRTHWRRTPMLGVTVSLAGSVRLVPLRLGCHGDSEPQPRRRRPGGGAEHPQSAAAGLGPWHGLRVGGRGFESELESAVSELTDTGVQVRVRIESEIDRRDSESRPRPG